MNKPTQLDRLNTVMNKIRNLIYMLDQIDYMIGYANSKKLPDARSAYMKERNRIFSLLCKLQDVKTLELKLFNYYKKKFNVSY